jgi:uncharacterized membrane protein YagU involved in acid resistance
MRSVVSAMIGFLVAPLIPAVIFALSSPGLGGGIDGNVATILGLVVVGYFFSAAATALLGVPLFLLLRRFSLVRWWSTLLVGFLIGVVVFFVVLPAHATIPIPGVLLFGFMGALSAFVFWFIWMAGGKLAKRPLA